MKNIKLLIGGLLVVGLFTGCTEADKAGETNYKRDLEALGIPSVSDIQENNDNENANIDLNEEAETSTEDTQLIEEYSEEEPTQIQEQYIETTYNIPGNELRYLKNIILGNGEEVAVYVDMLVFGKYNTVDLYFKKLDNSRVGYISYNTFQAVYAGDSNIVNVDIDEMNSLAPCLQEVKVEADMLYNDALQEWNEKIENQQFTPIKPVN